MGLRLQISSELTHCHRVCSLFHGHTNPDRIRNWISPKEISDFTRLKRIRAVTPEKTSPICCSDPAPLYHILIFLFLFFFVGCAVKWGIDQLLRACCRQKCGGWKRKLFLYSMFHSSVPLGTTQIRWRRLMLFNKQIRGVKTKSLSCTVCFINCLLSEGFKQYAHLSLLCCPAI